MFCKSGGHFQSRRLLASGNSDSVGAAISIWHLRGYFPGIVRYCIHREIGYLVGVEFDPEAKWSARNSSRVICSSIRDGSVNSGMRI